MSLATLDKPKVAARRVEFASLQYCAVLTFSPLTALASRCSRRTIKGCGCKSSLTHGNRTQLHRISAQF